MKNLDKWLAHTQNLFSPDLYKVIGWYFVVGAALQRRVWFGNIKAQPMFPNLYIFLVGPAAVGKGLVLSEVRRFLSMHKHQVEISRGHVVPRNIIEIGPNDTTYKAYIKALQSCTALHGTYSYSALVFVLEELETLFSHAEWTDKLMKMFLQIYDCKDYSYTTAESGSFYITNTCSSLIGGITPKNLVGLFKKNILTDGFASRTLIIIENNPSKQNFFLDTSTTSDFTHEIGEWIKKLTKLYGEVTIAPEVRAFVEDWWEKDCKSNYNPRLEGFRGRKRAHVLKLAMCIHFSDSTTLELSEEDFRAAIELVNVIEKRLEENIELFQMNEFALVAEEIVRYINGARRPVPFSEIARRFPMKLLDLKGIIDHLVIARRIKNERGHYSALT